MSSSSFKNLKGNRYGRLLVLEYAGKVEGKTAWTCKCDCGAVVVKKSANLSAGTESCGCLQKEVMRKIQTTHGLSDSPEYTIWRAMKQRCQDPSQIGYCDYGGRGIKVCEEWVDDFKAFYDFMGPRPTKDYTIERLNVDGDYCPDNCVWLHSSEQGKNKRNNVIVFYKGEQYILADLIKKIGISSSTARRRSRDDKNADSWRLP